MAWQLRPDADEALHRSKKLSLLKCSLRSGRCRVTIPWPSEVMRRWSKWYLRNLAYVVSVSIAVAGAEVGGRPVSQHALAVRHDHPCSRA